MAIVPQPSKGQPLDISYLATMAQALDTAISRNTTGSQSKIKYADSQSTETINTQDLVIYAGSNKIEVPLGSSDGVSTTFSFNFKSTPIVVASIESTTKNIPALCVVENIGTTSCTVVVYPMKTVASSTLTGHVSIVAIGQAN